MHGWHLHDGRSLALATSALLYAVLYIALEISEMRSRSRG